MTIDTYKQLSITIWLKNGSTCIHDIDVRRALGISKWGTFKSSGYCIEIHWNSQTHTGTLSGYFSTCSMDEMVKGISNAEITPKILEEMWNNMGDLYVDSWMQCQGVEFTKYDPLGAASSTNGTAAAAAVIRKGV